MPHHAAARSPSRHERARPDPRFRRAVHAADRPARARERRLLRDPAVHRRRRRDPRLRAQGDHPLGRPGLDHRGGSAARAATSCSSSACRSSASATASRRSARQLGGKVEIGHHREFGRAFIEVVDRCRPVRGAARAGRSHQVWMSHGDKVVDAAAGLPRGRDLARARPSPRSPTMSAGSTACSSTPRWCTRPTGGALLRNFTHRVAGCRGDWSMARLPRERDRARSASRSAAAG